MATTAEVLKELARKGYLDARTTGNVLHIQDRDLVLPRNASNSRARDLASWAVRQLEALSKTPVAAPVVAPVETPVVVEEPVVESVVEPVVEAEVVEEQPTIEAPKRRRKPKAEATETVED